MRTAMNFSTGKVFIIIFLGLVSLTSYFIGFNYFNGIHRTKVKELDKLQAVSNAIVSSISPSEIKTIMDDFSGKNEINYDNQPELYEKYHQILHNCYLKNELQSPIYTIHKNDKTNQFEFGITSSKTPYFRHVYKVIPEGFHDLYYNGGRLEKYKTENGEWISVVTPLRLENGEVIGALEMDVPFGEFIQAARMKLITNALLSVVIYLVIGFIMFRFVAKVIKVENKQKEYEIEKAQLDRNRQTELDSSITYARRIQQALWPDNSCLRKDFNDFFLINIPKDTVSGDFYWHHKIKGTDKYIFIHADCTGHGVPGAMMSVLGNTIFNEIVINYGITKPCEILNLTNKKLITLLQQEKEENLDDGMTVFVGLLDRKEMTLQYAGANQDSVIVRNGQLISLEADKYPVGGAHYNPQRTYEHRTVLLEENDILYSYSDGFKDQFGGPKNKKFLSANFYKMLVEHSRKSLDIQKEMILQTFRKWKGNFEQIDDVSLVGLKI